MPNTIDMCAMSGTKAPALTAGVDRPQVPSVPAPGVPPAEPVPEVAVEAEGGHPNGLKPHVICGAGRHHTPTAPSRRGETEVPSEDEAQVSCEPADRLPAEQARVVMESCWAKGTPPTETARLATRSVSYVKRVFRSLDDDRGPAPVAGQLTLVKQEATA